MRITNPVTRVKSLMQTKAGREAKKAADANHRPNMVVGIRIDPARITLPKLRFMGEVPVHQHLLQDDPEA